MSSAPLILVDHPEGPIVSVRLNRPEVRNAFNDELIRELTELLKKFEKQREVRVVVLSGSGDFFSAGADLNWMKSMMAAPKKVNEEDARRLAYLLQAMNEFSKPLIGMVHGAAIGGGVGLAAVCDIVVAADKTVFALSEVKLGLIPAIISPFVIAKIGPTAARRYFLTGERFGADVALRLGLIHEVVLAEQLIQRTRQIAEELLTSGPEAVRHAKELIRHVGNGLKLGHTLQDFTVSKIATLRASPEGQEGMKAFLEKRKPKWNV